MVLEGTDYLTVSTLRGCGGLERTGCGTVLKELIFYSFYFGRLWYS